MDEKDEEGTPDKETDEGSEEDSKKIKTATRLSRKMPMKKLTPLKMKRTGLITSKEARKRRMNTWKNTM